MNESLKKRLNFAKQIRSQKKREYFQQERMKLLEAQIEGNLEKERQIFGEIVYLLGSAQQADRVLTMYEEYEKATEEYERQLQEQEEASMNFQKLQKQKILEQQKKQFLKLFQQLENQENQPKQEEKVYEI